MDAYHWLLFFHLVGAFCFFGGAAVAGTLQIAALRREKPSEILTLLRLTRVGVVLVVAGAVLTIAFGIALASHLGYGLTPAWIRASLGLWVASIAAGAVGGRTARHAPLPRRGGGCRRRRARRRATHARRAPAVADPATSAASSWPPSSF